MELSDRAPELAGDVLAIGGWANNAELVADVARLGYFDTDDKGTLGTVFDATYGKHGGFWKVWRPSTLTTNDLRHPADTAHDYRALPFPDKHFDAVVFDPPYKLNGTPALDEQDERYGVDGHTSRDEVMADIRAGAVECYRVTRRWLHVKCMDQVEGGRMRWQTDMVTTALEALGARKVTRFDIGTAGLSQPPGRRQRTPRVKHSTLLVFRKLKLATPKAAPAPELWADAETADE